MAPKIRPYDRNQIVIMMNALDELISDDHEVRMLWEYVQGMDLNSLLNSIKSRRGKCGAPTFDPRILLALWLYATARGVGSARELGLLCRESLPFRWLCADDAPNYHTLCDFRTAHGELLDKLLVDNLAALVSEGLVNPEEMTVAHDGVRVRASAGRGSFRRLPTLLEAEREAKERIKKLKDEVTNEPRSKRSEAARARAARERAERVTRARKKAEELEEKPRKKERKAPRASTTDPDAMRMKMANGGIDPAYNIQYTTDVKTRLVTAVGVGDCGSDYSLLLPAIRQHEERLGRLPKRVLADSGFAESTDIIALDDLGCDPFLPDKYGETERGKKHPALTRWRKRMKEEESKRLYTTERASTIEWLNAQLRNHGFRRITVRGKTKARIIALWQALTHNILQTFRLRKCAEATA